jgi:NADH-quinone oxidoreductase subunit E
MLTEEERTEIAAELLRYPERRAACIEALKIVQRRRGWVSDESLREVAALLGMTPDELDGVGTFYNLIFRQPVGRHVILLCDSVSCWIMGCTRLRERLQDLLQVRPGGTTADGRFTLLPIVCLGACDHAPAMMINDELHGDLAAQSLDAILERYP